MQILEYRVIAFVQEFLFSKCFLGEVHKHLTLFVAIFTFNFSNYQNLPFRISNLKLDLISGVRTGITAQKMMFSIKGFLSKCAHLLRKSLMENFIFV